MGNKSNNSYNIVYCTLEVVSAVLYGMLVDRLKYTYKEGEPYVVNGRSVSVHRKDTQTNIQRL